MNKNKKKINWNDEFAKSIGVLGKALLKGLGWAFSILITIGLIGVITGVIVGGAFLLYVKNHLDTSVDNFAIMAQERSLTTTISYIDEDGNPEDENGHGTHVAGIIVDCTNDLNVKIMPVRVLDANGYNYKSSVSRGIHYAILVIF